MESFDIIRGFIKDTSSYILKYYQLMIKLLFPENRPQSIQRSGKQFVSIRVEKTIFVAIMWHGLDFDGIGKHIFLTHGAGRNTKYDIK